MKFIYYPILSALSLSILSASVSAQDAKSSKDSKVKPKSEKKEMMKGTSKTLEASVTIDGKKIDYTVKAAELLLTNDKKEDKAKIFYVSYTVKSTDPNKKRPVMFAFNGGPGSSAVWLHLGALGPKIVPSSPDGTVPMKPPVTLIDNPHSILDVADLVFIDPVSTGYSRMAKSGKHTDFHGLEADITSVGDFIRRWVTENKRWDSPKFLLGESYGGVRAAGLSSHLQDRYGMNLNGVVLLSSLVDYRTLKPSQGNDLSYHIYLPALTATAHHHGMIKGDRDAMVKQAREYANGDYLIALNKGTNLTDEEKNTVAEKLSQLTSLDKQIILDWNLRIHPTPFRAKLLQAQGKVIGRFDARVAWDTSSKSDYPAFDPSFSVAKAPFTAAMMNYLSKDLGWEDNRVYEIITGKVHPWNLGSANSYTNMSSRIESAMQNNPNLKVLVQCGHTDLATPAGGILHTVDHMKLTKSQRDNVSVKWYDAGHMFYLNQPDLEKMRQDLVEFVESAK